MRLSELPNGSAVIHGNARGADRIADDFATKFGLRVYRYPAEWIAYGKRAGIIRNIQMLDTKPDLVLAFWDGFSRGTAHTIAEAEKRGIPVEIYGDSP